MELNLIIHYGQKQSYTTYEKITNIEIKDKNQKFKKSNKTDKTIWNQLLEIILIKNYIWECRVYLGDAQLTNVL